MWLLLREICGKVLVRSILGWMRAPLLNKPSTGRGALSVAIYLGQFKASTAKAIGKWG